MSLCACVLYIVTLLLDMVADVGLYEQFKMTPIGKLLTDNRYNRLRAQMIDAYLTDFVYMSHPCVNTTEHKVQAETDDLSNFIIRGKGHYQPLCINFRNNLSLCCEVMFP